MASRRFDFPDALGPTRKTRRRSSTSTLVKHRRRFGAIFPDFRIAHTEYLSFFAYPLSGGFKRWCLIPIASLRFVLGFEQFLAPLIGRLIGFRLLLVFEKSPAEPMRAAP